MHCNDCGSNFCAQHDQQAHTAPQLASHRRVSISEHAAQLVAASSAKRSAAFAAAAAMNRMTAMTEEKNIKQALQDTKEQLAAPQQGWFTATVRLASKASDSETGAAALL